MTRGRGQVLLIVTSSACVLGACRQAPPVPTAQSITSLDQVIDWVDSVTLEENDTALAVSPTLTTVDGGEYLVTDTREAQGRVYAMDGRLVAAFGRRGNGPGEFSMAIATLRVPTGDYVVVDRRGRLEFFGPDGGHVRTVTLPLRQLDSPRLLGDTLLLLAGRDQSVPELRLHLWDLRKDSLARSFFAPSGRLERETLADQAPMSTTIWGDTIVATVNTVDTLFYFSTTGELLDAMPIPFGAFRGITMPERQLASREWMSSWEQIVLLTRSESGTVLITSVTFSTPEWRFHLLGMTSDGRLRFDLQGTPRLQNVDGDLLVFNAPNADLPSQWARARLKHGW